MTVSPTILNQRKTLKVTAGCTVEYNMNSMLENISIYNNESNYDADYITQNGKNAFKKYFPIDSVIKPFRPKFSGIKYYIFLNNEHTMYPFSSIRRIDYPSNQPRVYLAGSDNKYKYFVSPQNKNIDLTVLYENLTKTISSAYSTGTTESSELVYTTTIPHALVPGQSIASISGVGSGYNFSTTKTVNAVRDSKTFTILRGSSGSTIAPVSSVSGTMTLSQATPYAVSNKLIVRFEKYHRLPTIVEVTITYSNNTTKTTTISNFHTSFPDGELSLYPTVSDGNWTTTMPATVYDIPKNIKSIRVRAQNALSGTQPSNGNGYVIGLIEVSARLIKDYSNDIVNISIDKEASSSSEDILPVGKVTANSVSLSLSRYKDSNNAQTSLQIVPYLKSTIIDHTKINLYKDAVIKPYFRVYDSQATDVPGEYDISYQGEYYMDSWNISDRGDATIIGLDNAKILMETFPSEKLYENYNMISIIRAMLDSLGFTNYNFNYLKNNSNFSDNSVPTLKYWWTDGSKSAWECIQELCFDSQMNAVFDNNGILQFYTRDVIYDSARSAAWTFRYDASGNDLANIITFDNAEIPAVNKVKMIWSVPSSSAFLGNSTFLWQSPTSYLIAGGLLTPMTATEPTEGGSMQISASQTGSSYSNVQIPFSYNGYFLIDSEVVEFDAVEYQYESITTNNVEKFWVTSEADLNKIRNLSKTPEYTISSGSVTSNFRPTGNIRIKKRGALGTKPIAHSSTAEALSSSLWTGFEVDWK